MLSGRYPIQYACLAIPLAETTAAQSWALWPLIQVTTVNSSVFGAKSFWATLM